MGGRLKRKGVYVSLPLGLALGSPIFPSGCEEKQGVALGRRRGQGPHLAKRWEPRGFSRVAAAFSSYDGDLSLPLVLLSRFSRVQLCATP